MSMMGDTGRQLLGIVLGGACVFSASCATAQITPDRTLPNNSNVTINGSVFNITGGTQAGRNLFHSFQQFSVPTGSTASFNNGLDIQNIFSRVTGGIVSNIDGLIRANGTANLFLINPSGIIFGPHASLSLNGSFFASTANSLVFDNGFEFSATNPQASPLLTVNIPIGLRFRDNPGRIINQSIAVDANNNPVGLQVPSGNTLALLGSDVSLDGGRVTAAGGRVELGGLAAPGTVGLQVNGSNLSLSFPDNVTRADVSLGNGAFVNVAAGGGGSIAVNANNLNIMGGKLNAGIAPGMGSVAAKAGDITLNATGDIKIDGSGSIIGNNVGALNNPQNNLTKGNGGNVEINTSQLELTNGAQLQAVTFGQGDAGRVTITARDAVSFDGTDSNGNPSAALSTVEAGAIGNGGGVNINAGSLSLTNGGQLSANTDGKGNAGNINVQANGTISLISDNHPTGIFSNVLADAMGNGGNISLNSGSVVIKSGAQVDAFTRGHGDAGSVTITARDAVSFDGVRTDGTPSAAFSTVEAGAIGNGGGVNINAGSLSLTNGGQLSANTDGKGNAGNINVQANGTISLISDNHPTGIFSNVLADAMGNGGNISLNSGSVVIKNGAQVDAFTRGHGDAGSVTITARDAVSFDGVRTDGTPSAALSTVEAGAIGNGGGVNINAGSLSLTNGGQLSANTDGKGNAGNINVQANGTISLISDNHPTGIFSNVLADAMGNGGNISLNSGSVVIKNGAQVDAFTRGHGDAGSVTITARDAVSFDGVRTDGTPSAAFSTVEAGAIGNGGGVNINAGSLSLTNGGQLSANTDGKGNAGSINVQANGTISLISDNHPTGIFSNVLANAMGNGGNISLNSGSVVIKNGAQVNAFTRGHGDAGSVTITARDAVSFDGVRTDGTPSASFSDVQSGGVGNGGSINITANSLSLTNGGQLGVGVFGTSNTLPAGQGNGGIININVRDTLTVLGTSSNIRSGLGIGTLGRSGNIQIESGKVQLIDGGFISSRSQGRGAAGNININAGLVSLNNGQIIAQTTSSNGGNINFNLSQYLLLRNSSLISANAGTVSSGGNGGNITITAPVIVAFPSNNDITANAFSGIGGNVKITTSGLFGIAPLSRAELEQRLNTTDPSQLDPSRLPTSDITAISQQNPSLNGTINLNTSYLNPSQSLVKLPENVVDPTTQIAQNPCQRGTGSSFAITGRGGIPSNPNQTLASDNVRVGLVTSAASPGKSTSTTLNLPSTTPTVKRLVPVHGWIFNDKGQVVLTAYDPTNTGSQRSWQKPASCAKR